MASGLSLNILRAMLQKFKSFVRNKPKYMIKLQRKFSSGFFLIATVFFNTKLLPLWFDKWFNNVLRATADRNNHRIVLGTTIQAFGF